MLNRSHATDPVLLVVEVALGALDMDYNSPACCINIKQNTLAAKTWHLKKLPFFFCCFGGDTWLFVPHCSFSFFNFNLSLSYLTDFSVRSIKWVFFFFSPLGWLYPTKKVALWMGIIALLWKLWHVQVFSSALGSMKNLKNLQHLFSCCLLIFHCWRWFLQSVASVHFFVLMQIIWGC